MAGGGRERLMDEEPFSFRATRDGKVLISWRGRTVTILKGREAASFLERVASGAPGIQQLEMARVTGNFKRGAGEPENGE